MNLLSAIEIAENCDLSTIGEAKLNIEMHANSLFDYDKLTEELQELENDVNRIVFDNGFNLDESISSIKYLLLGK